MNTPLITNGYKNPNYGSKKYHHQSSITQQEGPLSDRTPTTKKSIPTYIQKTISDGIQLKNKEAKLNQRRSAYKENLTSLQNLKQEIAQINQRLDEFQVKVTEFNKMTNLFNIIAKTLKQGHEQCEILLTQSLVKESSKKICTKKTYSQNILAKRANLQNNLYKELFSKINSSSLKENKDLFPNMKELLILFFSQIQKDTFSFESLYLQSQDPKKIAYTTLQESLNYLQESLATQEQVILTERANKEIQFESLQKQLIEEKVSLDNARKSFEKRALQHNQATQKTLETNNKRNEEIEKKLFTQDNTSKQKIKNIPFKIRTINTSISREKTPCHLPDIQTNSCLSFLNQSQISKEKLDPTHIIKFSNENQFGLSSSHQKNIRQKMDSFLQKVFEKNKPSKYGLDRH